MKLTASKLHLASKCLYWARDDVPSGEDAVGPEAQEGNAFHEAAHRLISVGTVDLGALYTKHGLTPDARDRTCARVAYWTRWWSQNKAIHHGRSEVAFDFREGKAFHLGENIGREYPPACVLPGTADFVALCEDSIVLYDWKTGAKWKKTDPRAFGQLAYLGMCAARFYGVDKARVGYVHISPKRLVVHEAVIDLFDFAAVEHQAGLLIRSVEESLPSAGWHCGSRERPMCRAYSSCPARAVVI